MAEGERREERVKEGGKQRPWITEDKAQLRSDKDNETMNLQIVDSLSSTLDLPAWKEFPSTPDVSDNILHVCLSVFVYRVYRHFPTYF